MKAINSAHSTAQGLRPSYDSKRVEAAEGSVFFSKALRYSTEEVVCQSTERVKGMDLPFLTGQELYMHK
jgi:hypothetical protein